jgi:hypothetical protein
MQASPADLENAAFAYLLASALPTNHCIPRIARAQLSSAKAAGRWPLPLLESLINQPIDPSTPRTLICTIP